MRPVKEGFLRGALILTAAGMTVKVIGSVNRILLSRLLGGEGIGLYQMAYPIYLLLLAVSSAGLPVAISILVSENLAKGAYGSVRRIFRLTLLAMAGFGLLLAVLLAAGASVLVQAGLLQDSRAYWGLLALTPAVFFATVLASFRGYFQGQQLMTPPALSQVLEQIVRVTAMLALAWYLLPLGLEYAAAGAAFGAVPGTVTGLVVLTCFYFYYGKCGRLPPPAEEGEKILGASAILKKLFRLALPVSCANILVPLNSLLDLLLVPRQLIAAGFDISRSTALFGYLTGMAQPLVMMATIPTASLATSIVPAVAALSVLGDKETLRKRAATALKLCLAITLPAAMGLSVLAEPVGQLLFATGGAAAAIAHSGPAICLLGLQQVTTGLLQGLGRTKLPMYHMLAGLALKTAALCILTDRAWNIAGAAQATNIGYGACAFLNLYALWRLGSSCPWQQLGKIALAAALTAAGAGLIYNTLDVSLGMAGATAAAILGAAVLYIALAALLRIITKEEAAALPVAGKLFK